MEKELDPDVLKTTQSSLGKYVKRPPLSEKLLKKPPFRFLHDIVTTILKTTGFFEGLFEPDELISDNVKDRESKILFLNKVISVVEITTGKSLSVKPSKIVAGQEPEKTNELLQCLAQALDKKLSSKEAVQKYKDGTKSIQPVDKKIRDQSKAIKNSNDVKKLAAKSSEKLTSNKRAPSDRSLTRTEKNEKDKTIATKTIKRESSVLKKESPPKKTSQTVKVITKKNSVEKPSTQNENSKRDSNKTAAESDATENENVQSNNKEDNLTIDLQEKQEHKDSSDNVQQTTFKERSVVEPEKLNSSYTIAENDLNSSLSSQDLMEVDNEKTDEMQFQADDPNNERELTSISQVKENEAKETKLKSANSIGSTSSEPESLTKYSEKNDYQETVSKSNTLRPPSVRPSSSRPGAPRLREKHDNVIPGNNNILVGKVNIIVENAPNEEEEDTSIIIVEQEPDPSLAQEQQSQLPLPSSQHGHLVQQILDSQKELSQISGKTEIEWQFGAQKAREALNQEIEQLKFNIQALSRVANPLGKLLDHIQEDVEVMRQELQQWTKTYDEASKELLKQKTANEDSLFPLRTKLKQLHVDTDEKRDKINDLKIVIHKNSCRIEKLLASGNVQ